MPPIAPAVPPMPTTEATALRGNISELSVKRFADQPWWAEAASAMIRTATHWLDTFAANITGTTHSAHTNIAVLRARLVVQPCLIQYDDIQPPPMLPTSASR